MKPAPLTDRVMTALLDGGDTLHELHEMTGINKSTVAYSIGRLEQLGKIRRTGRFKRKGERGSMSPCFEPMRWA